MNGVLLVDKAEGLTSAAVVRVVKKGLGGKKVGHLGTLDPFASGLLPLCIGDATKIAQFLLTERKQYTGTIRLGVETDTLDATGKVLRESPIPAYSPEVLGELARRFCGAYWQTPPMYSAIKRQGVPLYKLARRGIEVERAPRQVVIEEFTLTPAEHDTLRFFLSCSKGTYVRSLAADVGAALGCGAHLATLRRTAVGPFTVNDAVPFAALDERIRHGTLPLLSVSQALGHYRAFPLPPEAVTRLRRGQQEVLRSLPAAGEIREVVQLLGPDGELVALAEQRHGKWHLVRVL